MTDHDVMRLLVVRHGAAAVPTGAYPDHEGMPLSAQGVAQARALADGLRDLGLRRIIASPLARARETADWLAKAAGLGVEIDERLRERVFPSLYGLTFDEIERQHGPAVRKALAAGNCDEVLLVGTDDVAQHGARVRSLVSDVVRHNVDPVALVCHGGPHEWLVAGFLGLPGDRRHFELEKGRLTVLDIDRRTANLRRLVALNISARDYGELVSGKRDEATWMT